MKANQGPTPGGSTPCGEGRGIHQDGEPAAPSVDWTLADCSCKCLAEITNENVAESALLKAAQHAHILQIMFESEIQ